MGTFPVRKLTDEQRAEIRAAWARETDFSRGKKLAFCKNLGPKYDVHPNTIRNTINGRNKPKETGWVSEERVAEIRSRWAVNPLPPETLPLAPFQDEIINKLITAHRNNGPKKPFFYHLEEMIMVLAFGWRLPQVQIVRLNLVDFTPDGSAYPHTPTPGMKKIVNRWQGVRITRADFNQPALLISTSGRRIGINSLQRLVRQIESRSGVILSSLNATARMSEGQMERFTDGLTRTSWYAVPGEPGSMLNSLSDQRKMFT